MPDDFDRRKVADSIEYLCRNGLNEGGIAKATGVTGIEVVRYQRCETPTDGNFCITVTDLYTVVKSLTERSGFQPDRVTAWFEEPCRHRAEVAALLGTDDPDPNLEMTRLELISKSPMDVFADAAQEEMDRLNAATPSSD
jgi:hypothetical protein